MLSRRRFSNILDGTDVSYFSCKMNGFSELLSALLHTREMKCLKFFLFGSLVSIFILIGGTYWVGTRLTAPAPANIGAPPTLLPAQSVHFSNSRGIRLAGWYISGRPDCGTVILMHAIRGNRASMAGRAPFLHRTGYSLLFFDFQAHGESEGEIITFGDLEKEDVQAAIQFASQRNSSSPIGIIGFSLGGVAAVLNGAAIGADALILEAVFTTLEQTVINRIRQRIGFLAPLLAHPLLFHLQFHYGIDPQELRPIDFIHSLGIPVFVMGGTHDQHTLQSETETLFSLASSPKDLWLVKGAHHQNFHQYTQKDYETRVLAFLNKYVGCASTGTK